MKIGFFDSGLGGLYTMSQFRTAFPQYDYLYYGDQKNVPYGNKTEEEIRSFTIDGINRLFDHGAGIVILACNTAASVTVKYWQAHHPEKKVLSISIPVIEYLIQHKFKHPTIFSTTLTKNTHVFPLKFEELGGDTSTLSVHDCPDLVMPIEQGADDTILRSLVQNHCDTLSKDCDVVVLGCTHFPIIKDIFHECRKGEILDPTEIALPTRGNYLERHPEITHMLTTGGTVEIHTTGIVDPNNHFMKNRNTRDR